MKDRPISFGSRRELKAFVHEILCQHEELEPGFFQMTEEVLNRDGKACGVHFCLHGPRSVRCTSIWTGKQILFYAANGERFKSVELTDDEALSLREPRN